MSGIVITLDQLLPEEFEAGRGGCLVLQGRASSERGTIKELKIDAGTCSRVELFPAEHGETGEPGQRFFAMLDIPERMTGS
ncbi:MAG: hypothetical protein U9Q71_04485, partial [Pseudomonadota bacterium]|nr:hypothetical protein [Pseudomonadota bacterium]